MHDWSREDVSALKGVGPAFREKLARMGIHSKQQLLFHLPLRYEDRTRVTALGSLQTGQHALIQAEVLLSSVSYQRRRVLVAKLSDGTGIVNLRFFHFNAAQQQRLGKGCWIRAFGEVRWVMGALEMVHPEYESIDPHHVPALETFLTPVYPTTEGLHQLGLRKIMKQLLLQLEQQGLDESLPQDWRQKNSLPDLANALKTLHNPRDLDDVTRIQSHCHPAQHRFIVEEFAAHRVSLLQRRQQLRQLACPAVSVESSKQKQLESALEFELTSAQQRVIAEIMQDYEKQQPMMRLLQGDVGSGKTIVSAMAVLPLIDADYQCALMAPTEILAEQHLRNFSAWLEPLGIRVLSLTGADKGKKRQAKEQLIACGEAQMVIGTHALFQASVGFARLGMIIIDEQHRFGVHQRQALQKKAGDNMLPHQLIMTATPIPRTLAMSVYADLDYSQIDELPPGRVMVKTSIIAHSQRQELVSSVRKACADGQQIYWVCTLIEESDALQCEAAEMTYTKLSEQLSEVRVGLVHGRMKSAQKDEIIKAFRAGEIDLLVATTVIEVGVDVPNASIMIIENPERLGLSQIHQLRGRVGRGNKQSFCLLLVKNDLSTLAAERLDVIRNHQDGFLIAERDLEIRGAGEVMGTRQTGEASFRIADLVRDKRWFSQAESLADRMMQPDVEQQRLRLLENWVGHRLQYSDVG
jgi:ATP-dependent DNA helicase RecG